MCIYTYIQIYIFICNIYIYIYIYLKYPVSLNFCIFSMFLVNGPQALYLTLGSNKCISQNL